MRSYSQILTRVVPLLVVVGLVALQLWHKPTAPGTPSADASNVNAALVAAARAHESGVEVEAHGVVSRLLPEDTRGSRHQRFLVRIGEGLTVLVAHNRDLAPSIPIQPGDSVVLQGEYIWNERGGMIHWTHHDPARRHQPGWIEYHGHRYE
jgi:hypothetical protein